ncbi:MAG: hypothetical protein AVDCRST_MAG47-3216 [uncultured Nocardioidaceae bacterium]|uniref:Uncharacterized protein n=1 Tax=uncultured Nocardioidaceae bacterium TaxID=253824 RepID=A0A6J4NU71_9ACTN|nr:MAG: hypothetical protein AVDCRST_MAG47-3216 [uncultured Nocardioidaceae bacterium]
MEPDDRPEVEVLDTERPPSAVQQWVEARLRHPAAKAAVAVVAALVLLGAWSVLPEDEPKAEADAEAVAAADTPPGLRPPPARGRESGTGSWQVADDLAIRTGPRGHSVTFTATNRGAEPQDPGQLEVTGAFVDRVGLVYRAACSAAVRRARGYRTIQGDVGPTKTVLVRCTDVTKYGGRTAWIDPSSVTVRLIPCESDASSLPM